MIVGGAVTIVTLLALAWVREAVGGIVGVFGGDPTGEGTKITIIVIATIMMWCLDFAINTGENCFTQQPGKSGANSSYSPSGYSVLYRRQCPSPPAGVC